MIVTPKHYGLSPRIQLEEISNDHIAIVKRIKSRIIRKDALKLIEIAEKIKGIDPKLQVSLLCNDNICSKSKVLLEENQVDVIVETV